MENCVAPGLDKFDLLLEAVLSLVRVNIRKLSRDRASFTVFQSLNLGNAHTCDISLDWNREICNFCSWMTTYLGKSCSFCLPLVPFVNCRQIMYLVISLLVLRAGYGIWLYQFLIIAYLFILVRRLWSQIGSFFRGKKKNFLVAKIVIFSTVDHCKMFYLPVYGIVKQFCPLFCSLLVIVRGWVNERMGVFFVLQCSYCKLFLPRPLEKSK